MNEVTQLKKKNLELRRQIKNQAILIDSISEVKTLVHETSNKVENLRVSYAQAITTIEMVSKTVNACDYCNGRARETIDIKGINEALKEIRDSQKSSEEKLDKKFKWVMIILEYPALALVSLYILVWVINYLTALSPIKLIEKFILSHL